MFTLEQAQQCASEKFGIESLYPEQEAILQAIAKNQDVLAVLRTGGGKSLCYQLPGALDGPIIVVSPLIALMREQTYRLNLQGIPAIQIHSESDDDFSTIRDRLMTKTAQIIYSSPEQLVKESLSKLIDGIHFNRLAVDEAHCVSRWGHDFRPAYLKIPEFAESHHIQQILAFTATASHATRADIEKLLHLKNPQIIHSNLLRPNLEYSVIALTETQKTPEKLNILLNYLNESQKPAIVYVSNRREVKEVAKFLQENCNNVEAYHAKLEGNKRREIENRFDRNEIEILVSTNAFGMGIDKDYIPTIIHYSLPGSVESYIQETGRAGRNGQVAQCKLMYYPKDIAIQESLNKKDQITPDFIFSVYQALKTVEQYAQKQSGYFTLNFRDLYKRFSIGNATSILPLKKKQISAAIEALKNANVIESYDTLYMLKPLTEKAKIEIQRSFSTRTTLKEFQLSQMIRYANHPNPTQELLLELLEEMPGEDVQPSE